MRTLRTRGAWNENTPARTVRLTSLPLSVIRIVAGSLTRKRRLRNERTRSLGTTVSIRNSTVCMTMPTSFVALSTPAYLPSFSPVGFHETV